MAAPNDPSKQAEINPYPESRKFLKAKEFSQEIGEFVEVFLQSKGILLASYGEGDELHENRLYPAHKNINDLLAEFFGIDLDKLERERMAMLEEIRSKHAAE